MPTENDPPEEPTDEAPSQGEVPTAGQDPSPGTPKPPRKPRGPKAPPPAPPNLKLLPRKPKSSQNSSKKKSDDVGLVHADAVRASLEPAGKPPANLKVAPPEFCCNWVITRKDGSKERCTRYTQPIPEGGRSPYCYSHTDTVDNRRKRTAAGHKGAMTRIGHTPQDPRVAALLEPIGYNDLLTQDDVRAERQRILYQSATGKVPAAAANALLAGLQQASSHIEMFGGKQGVEGGAGYLRLLPGVRLMEELDERNRPLTSEEMKLIYERQAEAVSRGQKPPKTWQECILLYLGIEREPEVAYDEKQEPVGEYRCEVVKDAKTGEKSILRIFVRYKSTELTKERLKREAAALERLRGKTPK